MYLVCEAFGGHFDVKQGELDDMHSSGLSLVKLFRDTLVTSRNIV